MRTELLSQDKNVVKIKVIIDWEDFSKVYARTLNGIKATVNIPGFRKGKAPAKIIESRFGKASIMADALDSMMNDTLRDVVAEYDLSPIDQPDVNFTAFEDGKDVEFEVAFELEPEVTLPDFSKIVVSKPVLEVTDQMVDDALESTRKDATEFVHDDGASVKGDKVRATYLMTVVDLELGDSEGLVIVENEKAEETFDLTNPSLRAEISDALAGVKAGDTATVDIPIADDFQDKFVAGKTARYRFEILEVLKPVVPELDEVFFKKITGRDDIKTLDEMKAFVRENMALRIAEDAQTAAENDCVAKVAEAAELEIPESMMRSQMEGLRNKYEENIKSRTGKSLEDFYKDNNQDFETFEKELREEAKRDIRIFLTVEACAKEWNISVEKAEVDAEVAKMAASYHVPAQNVLEMLQKRPEELKSLLSSIRYRKTVQAMMDKVTVEEVKLKQDDAKEAQVTA